MRNLYSLDEFRINHPTLGRGDGTCGFFIVKSKTDGGELACMASCGEGWDHLSVSRKNRCPNWNEMEQVKRLFFRDDEIAMQLHVSVSDHISVHPFCLHIWKPQEVSIPLPPAWMVA